MIDFHFKLRKTKECKVTGIYSAFQKFLTGTSSIKSLNASMEDRNVNKNVCMFFKAGHTFQ